MDMDMGIAQDMDKGTVDLHGGWLVWWTCMMFHRRGPEVPIVLLVASHLECSWWLPTRACMLDWIGGQEENSAPEVRIGKVSQKGANSAQCSWWLPTWSAHRRGGFGGLEEFIAAILAWACRRGPLGPELAWWLTTRLDIL